LPVSLSSVSIVAQSAVLPVSARISEVTGTYCKQVFWPALGAAMLSALAACKSGGQAATADTATPAPAPATASSATVTWVAPNQNADGSALTNLAGFHVYYGTDANVLAGLQDVRQASASSAVVANLKSGTYFFAVSAYTANGTESELSEVVSKQIG
jgi:hypothetical protein